MFKWLRRKPKVQQKRWTPLELAVMNAMYKIGTTMEAESTHGMFYAHSELGIIPSMPELRDLMFREAIEKALTKQDKYEFKLAPPCPLDDWVLIVTHRSTLRYYNYEDCPEYETDPVHGSCTYENKSGGWCFYNNTDCKIEHR